MDQPAVLLLVVLALGLVVFLLLSRPEGKSTSPKVQQRALGNGQEKVLEQKLLSMTLGNRGAIERGVTAKRRQHPRASRAELLEMVYDDYVKDRSR